MNHTTRPYNTADDDYLIVCLGNLIMLKFGNFMRSILIRSNKMQQMQVFIYCSITLHVSGVYRTHHQEYIKL